MDYFTADWNLNHFNIIKYQGRPYRTTEEMNNSLIETCNRAVGPVDRLFFLGGFLFGPLEEKNFVKMACSFRERINCKNIFLIYGNHDRRGRKAAHFRNLFSFVGDYLEILSEGENSVFTSFVLSHYPIEYPYWNRIKDGAIHLHGHTYGANLQLAREQRKLDVGIDGPIKRPWSTSDILSYLSGSTPAF